MDHEPTSLDNEDDAEGHRFSSSDQNIKHDIQPVVSEDEPEGSEGHLARSGRVIKPGRAHEELEADDTEGHGMRGK